MRKICFVITSRGNHAKLKVLINLATQDDDIIEYLVVGGGAILPKYGGNYEFFQAQTVHFILEGETPLTMAKSAGIAVGEFATAFDSIKPDIVVLVGDRFEILSAAMAASYMNIPIAHIEGGEVSGSIDESIRHAVTKLSHIHFPATAKSAERIIRMGEDPKTVFNVGATSLDAIMEIDIKKMPSLQEKGVGADIDLRKPYIVVVQHPVTTLYEENLKYINETIDAVKLSDINVIWIWPNMDAGSDLVSKGIRIFREHRVDTYVRYFKSLPIELYALLLNNAHCIVGNSSAGIRESSFLGTPSVDIGDRQNGRERGENVIDVGYNAFGIAGAIMKQIKHGKYNPDHLYGNGNSSPKILKVLKECNLNPQKRINY